MSSLVGARVLLLEDEAVVNWSITEVLEEMGCAVSPCLKLEQAEQSLTGDGPDVAVLDVNINGQTSFALAKRLDELGVPIVFLTAYADLDEPWSRKPICSKPCQPERLRALLMQAMNAGNAARIADSARDPQRNH